MKPDGKSSIEFPDLTKTFPRSPRIKMAGLAHVARMTDKARALKMGTQGEYKYPCPLDEIVLESLVKRRLHAANLTRSDLASREALMRNIKASLDRRREQTR